MAALPFTPQRAVRWFSPRLLTHAGLEVAVALGVGGYLDKRELQGVIPTEQATRPADNGTVWFDFLADTGDGFDATYTMAWMLAQPSLSIDVPGSAEPGRPRRLRLPRGRLLVLGGDEVYPAATVDDYENRFVGPFQAAFPWAHHDHPTMLALPGNHDWYDGLTSFMRVFCQGKRIGGWQTRQRRSYFAVVLWEPPASPGPPAAGNGAATCSARGQGRWWLWGVDFQLDSYIDEPQLRYFEEQDLRPGDRIILCTGTPSWVKARWDGRAFRNLAYLERMINRSGARLVVTLTGDKHHYARYEGLDGQQKITAGGGGGFLHPTHDLPASVTLDVSPPDRTGEAADRQLFLLQESVYPDAPQSRRWALAALGLALRNPTFLLLPAVVHSLLMLASAPMAAALLNPHRDPGAPRPGVGDLARGLLHSPTAAILTLLVGAVLVAFAKPGPGQARRGGNGVWKFVMGGAHGVAQAAGVVGVEWLAVTLVQGAAAGTVSTAAVAGLVAGLGALVGSLVMGGYLAVSTVCLKAHGNETFSSLRLTRCKNFLRLRIDPTGALTIYPIGLPKVTPRRHWEPAPTGDGAWLVPKSEQHRPAPFLIEGPIVVGGPDVTIDLSHPPGTSVAQPRTPPAVDRLTDRV